MTTILRKSSAILALITASTLGHGLVPQAHAQTPSGVIYNITDVEKKPAPKRRIKPEYPESITNKDTPSEITLRIVITPEGTVTDITVVRFSDPAMIDPVYTAYEEARFTPGEKNGVKVATRMEVTEVYPQPKKK